MVELVGSCVAKAEKKKRENEKMKNEGSCAIVSREQKDVRPGSIETGALQLAGG
jgi:hypothetical protein